MTPNTRKPNEKFSTYKQRRAIHSQLDKAIAKGKLIWHSLSWDANGMKVPVAGTYVKADHGPIGGN